MTLENDELGIVSEGARRREQYGHFARKAPAPPAATEATPEIISPELRAAIERRVDEVIARRIERRCDEIVAQHIEAAAQRRAAGEIARLPALDQRMPATALAQLVAEVTNVPLAALLSNRRSLLVAQPRHLAIWLIDRCRPDLTVPQIAAAMRRDHTSIMNALRKMANRKDRPPYPGWIADPRVQAALVAHATTHELPR